jgi:hypothetical protein
VNVYLPSSTYAQINHYFSGAGYPRGAQITYGVSGTAAFASPSTLATNMHAKFTANVMPQLSTSMQCIYTRAKIGPNSTGPFGFAGSPVTGGISGDADVPSVAILVSKITASGGRANAGRWFLPGLSETYTSTGGTVDATYLANLQAALTAWLTAVNADTTIGDMVILHSSTSATPTPITNVLASSKVATQRRRLRKVGGRRRTTP